MVDKSQGETDAREGSRCGEHETAIREFVGEIHVLLTSMASMCACLHAPHPEPWNPAQHRALEIVEKALRDALSVIDRVSGAFDKGSTK